MKTKYFATAVLVIGAMFVLIISCSKENASDLEKNSPDGKSGSTAKITIKGHYLYAIDNKSIKVVDIQSSNNPQHVNTVDIGFGIETIYPFKEYLFIGSNDGMYIYSLTDPENPQHLSSFAHVTSCDPVIANDEYAFVTLRNNEVCRRWQNVQQVDIIDIHNVTQPFLVNTYWTDDYPYGLDMTDEHLFVCHGPAGVVVYNIDKMMNNLNAKVSQITGINAFDAIFYQNILFIIGENGFYQYDYSDIHNITLISSILKNQ